MKKNRLKNKTILPVLLIVFIGIFLYGNFARAELTTFDKYIIMAVGWIASLVVWVFGKIVTIAISAVITIAQYNNFTTEASISDAWVIIRDLSNMFFILILLIIAFATILRVESYQVKKLLPKLLIMAVLINFSKTICGLIIDFAQVIMLTFVGAFADAPGNFVATLKVDTFLDSAKNIRSLASSTPATEPSGEMTLYNTVGAILLGVVFMAIAAVVMVVLLAVITIRMVMLWIYVILSPLAFLLSAFPSGQKYSQQWWTDFTKQVVTGPILAFFIWLALMAVSKIQDIGLSGVTNSVCYGTSSIMCGPNFMQFVVAIGMLIGGLIVTQQAGGAAGAAAGKGMAWASRLGSAPLALGKAVGGGGLKLSKAIGGWAVDKASLKAGVDLNVARGWKRLRTQMDINKESRAAKVYETATAMIDKGGVVRSNLAHLSTGNLAWQSLTNWYKPETYKRALMGGKRFTERKEKLLEEGKKLKEERASVVTPEEMQEIVADKADKRRALREIKPKVEAAKTELDHLKATGADDKKIEKAEKIHEELFYNEKTLDDELKEITKREYSVKVNAGRAAEIDTGIKKNEEDQKEHSKFEVSGAYAARAEAMAELESKEGKIIARIDNNDQLGKMFEEAMRNERPGLAAAIAKKMTRNGDYNELMRHRGYGTGLKGMTQLAGDLQKSGMSEQSALGVVADMGQIAKGINHFGAFGAVTMEKGKFRMSTEDEYEGAKFAEMMKLQTQNFARNVNRLGLGYYDPAPGEGHSVKNWKLSKAATAYIKLNGWSLADNWLKTGQQNALEHVYSRIEDLIRNGVTKDIIDVVTQRTKWSKGKGADPAATVKSVK